MSVWISLDYWVHLSVGFLSPDTSRMPLACSAEGAKAPRDYADYAADSAFGRAAPSPVLQTWLMTRG